MLIATDNKKKTNVIVDIKPGRDDAKCLFASGDKVYHPIPYGAISWVPDDTVLKK